MELPKAPADVLRPLRRLPSNRRWIVVATLFAALAVFAPVALAEALGPREVGLSAAAKGNRMMVSWVQPEGIAWDAGIRPGDEVVRAEGRPIMAQGDPAVVGAASDVRVRVASGETLETSSTAWQTPNPRPYAIGYIAVALCFVLVGGTIYAIATDTDTALALLSVSITGAVAFVTSAIVLSGSPLAIQVLHLSLLGFDVTLLAFFLVFPVNRLRNSRAGRGILVGGFVMAATLVVFYVLVVAFRPAAFEVLRYLMYGFKAALVMCFNVLMVFAIRDAWRRPEARAALTLMILGMVLGFGPQFWFHVLPTAVGLDEVLPMRITGLAVAFFPVSVGVAVLSRQFFGITHLVRRGVVAFVVWAVLLCAYSIALYALGLLLTDARGAVHGLGSGLGARLGFTALCAAVVAGTFPTLQAGLRRVLDRALFGDVYDYTETLRSLSDETVRLAGAEKISGHVLGRLGGTLDLSWAAIALETDASAPGIPGARLYRWGACPEDLEARLFADASGDRPGGPGEATLVPLVSEGEEIGHLAAGPKNRDVELLPEDQALLATFAPLVATALKNALLLRRLEGQVAALGERERELGALSGKLMRVQEEERRRLALDLHDEPLQRAALLAREMGGMADCPDTRRWHEAVEEIATSLRAISAGVRPLALDDLGLVAGLEQLVGESRARSDLEIHLAVEAPDGDAFGRLGPDLETALYRVAQEALNNCLKHAEATLVAVELRRDERSVWLRVTDNGRGSGSPSGPRRAHGGEARLGILGMRERLRPWGGIVTVRTRAGEGTVVSAQAPLRKSPDGMGG